MKTQSADTSPKTERLLISLSKRQSTAKKFSQIRSLSRTVILSSRRAITRANTTSDADQINFLFIHYHYGEDLAERFRKYLNSNHHETP
jgi:hypothetical protein